MNSTEKSSVVSTHCDFSWLLCSSCCSSCCLFTCCCHVSCCCRVSCSACYSSQSWSADSGATNATAGGSADRPSPNPLSTVVVVLGGESDSVVREKLPIVKNYAAIPPQSSAMTIVPAPVSVIPRDRGSTPKHIAGLTSMHHAARSGDVDGLKRLLDDARNNVNAVTEDGWTPMHYAVAGNHLAIVSLLLADSRFDFRVANKPLPNDGCTLFDLAKKLPDMVVFNKLRSSPRLGKDVDSSYGF